MCYCQAILRPAKITSGLSGRLSIQQPLQNTGLQISYMDKW